MTWNIFQQWFGTHTLHPGSENIMGEASSKVSRKKTFFLWFFLLIFVLYGVALVILLVKNFKPSSAPENCDELLKTLTDKEITDTIFAGKWTLQEAYSTDSIDRYALTHAKSSWAQFKQERNGTIYLHMAHMLLRPENMTIWCVYHHFHNITLSNNTLHLELPEFNSSAKFQFLKACNECLALTAKAYVPGYEALNYLLVYSLHPNLDQYYIRRTRQQADCMELEPPAPFQYGGADFCPEDEIRRGTVDSFKQMLNILGARLVASKGRPKS